MIHKMDFKKLKSIKPIYLFAALSFGVIIVLLSGFSSDKPPPREENVQLNTVPDASDIEKRLEEIINSIDGVSDATVFVTYENSGVKKVATETEEENSERDGQKSFSHKTTAVTKKEGNEQYPFVKEETLPQIRGVIIAAKGLGRAGLDAAITDAVSSAVGVSLHRVKILSKD